MRPVKTSTIPDVRQSLHAGSKVGSNQPLETVNAGSSSSVDAPVEVDLTG